MIKIGYKRIASAAPVFIETFTVTTDCHRCGNKTQVAIDKDDDFDRSEAEYWQGKYEDLLGSVNTLISDTEHRTLWNPHKEAFARKLIATRDRLATD